jgi:hypothetical protein
MRFCSPLERFVQEHLEISLVAQAAGVVLARWRARSNTSESVAVWPFAAASSIHRAGSSRCAYHHAASCVSSLNFGILRFSSIFMLFSAL